MWHLVLLSQSLNVTCHMVGQASVTKATEICPERLEVRRTARNLDNEINLVKTKITTQQAQQGNREEIVKYVALTLILTLEWIDRSDPHLTNQNQNQKYFIDPRGEIVCLLPNYVYSQPHSHVLNLLCLCYQKRLSYSLEHELITKDN